MTQINLENPQVEERLAAYAREHGMGIAGVVEKLALEHLPPVDLKAFDERRRAAAIAFFDELLAHAPTDPEEIRRSEAEYQELLDNLNQNRIMAGEEPLFP